jgi:dimethylhistidine N-methyltransferase
VVTGLNNQPKTLPCRYFYDETGSQLFERICELPEYYLTRTEDCLLRESAEEIAAAAPDAELVELGSGNSRKTRRLIEALLQRRRSLRYVPVDICGEMLTDTAARLSRDYPSLEITPIAAEYFTAFRELRGRQGGSRLVLFLGSNLGNFDLTGAAGFLKALRSTLREGDHALINLDLRKSREVLEAAYDDAAGVTAQFNMNLLERINRELAGNFDLNAFRHRAVYNEPEGRVEMHLESLREQQVTVGGHTCHFAAGETIHTENSYKYTLPQIDELAAGASLKRLQTWSDARQWFSVNLFAPI